MSGQHSLKHNPQIFTTILKEKETKNKTKSKLRSQMVRVLVVNTFEADDLSYDLFFMAFSLHICCHSKIFSCWCCIKME